MQTQPPSPQPPTLSSLIELRTPLRELLQHHKLHSSIKVNIGAFLRYCHTLPGAVQDLIAMAVQWANQKLPSQTQSQLYLAADVLTSDHDLVADLLLPPLHSSLKEEERMEEEEIGEQIEADIQTNGLYCEDPQKRYSNIACLLVYLKSTPTEVTVNFISKVLSGIFPRKISSTIVFMRQNPQVVDVLIDLSVFPSMGRCIAKLFPLQEEVLEQSQIVKKRILKAVLEKLSEQPVDSRYIGYLEFLEELLHASRFSDVEQRSPLQLLSDEVVSHSVISFHLHRIFKILEGLQQQSLDEATHKPIFDDYSISLGYLNIVVLRINEDDQNYTDAQGPFQPTLNYQADQIYQSYCRLVSKTYLLFRLAMTATFQRNSLISKQFQTLLQMAKHSRFSHFYSSCDTEERKQAILALVKSTSEGCYKGLLGQLSLQLLQILLGQESANFKELKPSIDSTVLIEQLIKSKKVDEVFKHEEERSKKAVNQEQDLTCVRKMVMIIDNYAHERQSGTHLQLSDCYSDYSATIGDYLKTGFVEDHPAGLKHKMTPELIFIKRSKQRLQSSSSKTQESKEAELKKVSSSEAKPFMLKLNEKILSLKSRCSRRISQEEETPESIVKQPTPAVADENYLFEMVSTPPRKKEEVKVESHFSPQSPISPSLAFFVRHLTIY